MKKTILLSTSMLILAGCGTIKPPVKVDKEPILVGIPLDERVSRSGKTIAEQQNLLVSIQSKSHVGKYDMVEHNNSLEARKNSDKTLPQAYSTNDMVAGASPNPTPDIVARHVDNNGVRPELQRIIKKIEWEDSSANELAGHFAKALGYKIVISGDKDVKVTLHIDNESIMSAINRFRGLIRDEALVVVAEQNKTIFIAYKKTATNSPQPQQQ